MSMSSTKQRLGFTKMIVDLPHGGQGLFLYLTNEQAVRARRDFMNMLAEFKVPRSMVKANKFHGKVEFDGKTFIFKSAEDKPEVFTGRVKIDENIKIGGSAWKQLRELL